MNGISLALGQPSPVRNPVSLSTQWVCTRSGMR